MATAKEVTRSRTEVPLVQRVSWGAIVAGFLVAFGVQFLMEMLGISLGATLFDPQAANGIGTSAVIWLSVSALLSLFAGGYIAARLSGLVDEMDGMLHGIATWALVVLVNLLVLTFGTARVVGGVTSFVGTAVQGSSSFVSQVYPAAADALPDDLATEFQQSIEQRDGALEAILNDAASSTAIDSDNELETQEVRAAVRNFVVGGANLTEEELQEARQEAVDAIAVNSELSESEIEQQLNEWQQSYQQFADQVSETTQAVAERAENLAGSVAGVLFAALFVSAVAAGMGGWVGTQDHVPTVEKDEVTEHNVATATGD